MAILWHELWHEGLEDASRLYFGEKNVKGMFATLEPLHSMMERGPQTLKETSFNQVNLTGFSFHNFHNNISHESICLYVYAFDDFFFSLLFYMNNCIFCNF